MAEHEVWTNLETVHGFTVSQQDLTHDSEILTSNIYCVSPDSPFHLSIFYDDVQAEPPKPARYALYWPVGDSQEEAARLVQTAAKKGTNPTYHGVTAFGVGDYKSESFDELYAQGNGQFEILRVETTEFSFGWERQSGLNPDYLAIIGFSVGEGEKFLDIDDSLVQEMAERTLGDNEAINLALYSLQSVFEKYAYAESTEEIAKRMGVLLDMRRQYFHELVYPTAGEARIRAAKQDATPEELAEAEVLLNSIPEDFERRLF